MNICKLKNISGQVQDIRRYWQIDEEYTIPSNLRFAFSEDINVISAIMNGVLTVGDGSEYFTDKNIQINYLKGLNQQSVIVTEQPEPSPFAQPSYRTKLDASDGIVTAAVNDVTYSDYKMIDEKYVSGGELLVNGFEFGDWICAAVYDKDEVIPEAYRATLCENYPIINQYIIKRYVKPDAEGYGFVRIDTKPLNAKITANLYLRVGYHAINSGIDRKIVMNYDLTKKL